MKQKVAFVKIDVNRRNAGSEPLLEGEVAGATVFHHTIAGGSVKPFIALHDTVRILLLVEGRACFRCDGREWRFTERTSFVPAPDSDLEVAAENDLQLLEIQWKLDEADFRELKGFGTKFPLVQNYLASIQYRDRNKSDKTISRLVLEQRNVPRFCMGSVESYGPDLVAPHPHPMLDQFFFSFPENETELIIDGERMPMGGNVLLHIPLGSNHGVEVFEGRHMHYMWIDFIIGESGMKRLDTSHIPTGTMRSFDREGRSC